MANTRIVIDGKEYRSIEDMPPQVRETYERILAMAKQAGPPVVEESRSDIAGGLVSMQTRTATAQRFVFNGKEYARVEDMPPEVRELFLQAKQAALKGKGGGATVQHAITVTSDTPEQAMSHRLERSSAAFGVTLGAGPGARFHFRASPLVWLLIAALVAGAIVLRFLR